MCMHGPGPVGSRTSSDCSQLPMKGLDYRALRAFPFRNVLTLTDLSVQGPLKPISGADTAFNTQARSHSRLWFYREHAPLSGAGREDGHRSLVQQERSGPPTSHAPPPPLPIQLPAYKHPGRQMTALTLGSPPARGGPRCRSQRLTSASSGLPSPGCSCIWGVSQGGEKRLWLFLSLFLCLSNGKWRSLSLSLLSLSAFQKNIMSKYF